MLEDDATNLFEIIEDRTNINSTIITSQLPVSEWYNYLNNNTIADAILDRVVHSSHRIELEGDSMRKVHGSISKTDYKQTPSIAESNAINEHHQNKKELINYTL